MKGLRDTIISWVDQRMDDLLATPRMWGSDEAVEMQALLLLELRALTSRPEKELANPRRVLDAYTSYLGKTFPKKPNRPLFQIVEPDDLGYHLAVEFRRFLDVFGPTLLEENPFQHNHLAIRLRFKPGHLPTTSAFTGYYEEFRRAARATARRPGKKTGRVAKEVEAATDFELADVRITPRNGAPAEAMLLLGVGVGQQDLLANDLVRNAVTSMVELGEWASSSAGVNDLPVDDVQRRTLLALQTLRILPRGGVEEVGIGGQLIGRSRPVVFRADHERRLIDVVGASTPPQPFDQSEEIRAVDLDRGYIILGKAARLRCYVRPDHLPEVVAVGVRARVIGQLYHPIDGKPFVLVDTLEGATVPSDEGDES
jgi:hypothetical protein